MNPDIKPDDIAHYLQDHPEFFEQYADLLSLVTLADPHSGRAISITEKQMVKLRDKVRALEAKLAELIEADLLIILTTVEKVALHFGTPEQRWLDGCETCGHGDTLIVRGILTA